MRGSSPGHTFLLVLLVIAVVLLAMVFEPFVEAFLFAAVLAATLHPAYRFVCRKLRYRHTLAAALITVLVVVAVLVPLGSLATFLVREVIEVTHEVSSVVQHEGLIGIVNRLPGPAKSLAEKNISRFPDAWKRLQSSLIGGSGKLATILSGLVQTTGSAIFQTVMMLIALFFFLTDGRRLVDWLEQISPLGETRTHELFHEFRRVSVSVLVSTVATAGVQAIVAFVGYLITGVPNPIFVSLITFFLAFVPSIGGGGVGVVAAFYLFATGHLVKAIVMFLWATIVVGLSDNVVKPLFIRGGVEIHGGVIFFALLGGLAAFGPIGLLLGPLSVSFFLALIRILRREQAEELQGAEELPLARIQARRDELAQSQSDDRH